MAFIPGGGYNPQKRYTASSAPYKIRRVYNPYNSRPRPMTSAARYLKTGAKIAIAAGLTRKYRIKRKLTKRIPQGVGSTFSSFTRGAKKMRRAYYAMWKNNQKYTVTNLSSTRLSQAAYGKQGISTFQIMGSTTFSDDLTRFAAGGTPTTLPAASLLYGSLNVVSTFTNVELTTCYVDIYELSPRFHIPSTGYAPSSAWTVGLQAETGVVSGYQNDPYEKPFRSRVFCHFYKVDKILRFELAPGESHKHSSTYNINKMIHGSLVNAFTYVKDYSTFQMYVVSGTPINDTTNTSLVSTSTITVDIVHNASYSVTKPANIYDQTVSTNGLNNITSAKVVTDTSVVSDGSA